MRIFQDTVETRKQSFISTFSICMTVPLNIDSLSYYCGFDNKRFFAETWVATFLEVSG